MQASFAIGVKELKVYLGSPMAYIVTMLFLFATGVAFVADLGDPFPEASLVNFFVGNVLDGNVFGAALVLIPLGPVLTMRLLAEEKKLGTIELLLTAPVRDWEVVLGKYGASLAILLLMLLLTSYYVLLLVVFGRPDIGPMYSGYLGIVLYAMVALAVGMFASSVTSNQMVAAVLGTGIMGLLYGASLLGEVAGGRLGTVMVHLGASGRLNDFVVGIVDSGNIVYFLSLTALFLFLAWRVLESGRWR